MNNSNVIHIEHGKLSVKQQVSANDQLADREANVHEVVERLSALPPIQYEICRKQEAKNLGLKLDTLDDYVKRRQVARISEQDNCREEDAMFASIVAWQTEVDLAVLLTEIEAIVLRYTVLDEQYAVAIVLWVAFTWLHDKATVSPILNLTSPEKRCGKSTLLAVIESLVCKPLPSGNITSAALFRSVQKWSPTLVIDEADTFLGSSDDMRGIINSGHYRNAAYVIRCDGDDNTPTRFTTWCPKVIAGIGSLAETIMDRSVIVVMKRKLPGQVVESIRHQNEDEFLRLTQKLKRWSQDNAEGFKTYRPHPVKGLNDRANDNWEPLLAIACLAGDGWKRKAYQAALDVSGLGEETPSIGEQLLIDVLEVFANRGDDKIQTSELINSLCMDDEKPWATYHRGQNITPLELSKMLKPFGIKSENLRLGTGVKKGFYQADFEDAVSRYAPEKAATSATSATEVVVKTQRE